MLAAALAAPGGATAAGADGELYEAVRRLMSGEASARRAAAAELKRAADPSWAPALVDAVFFTPRGRRGELYDVLAELTGERVEGYKAWVEAIGARTDIRPAPGYADWKRELLERIDPGYGKVLYPGAPARIRLEEVVSGGVRLAGIPALDRPPVVPAAEAKFMRAGERVFAAVVAGEARAYPRRVLSWHEMLNDEIGGEPVTLSYCTLCGSGILYATRTPAGGAYTFDTSGLLYRSNKLMVDRQSYTLWSQLTGEPVIGRRARGDVRLAVLPATVTTWREWRRRHPETTVLDVRRLAREVGSAVGFDYRTGAADRARRGVSFPVWLRSDRLPEDAEIFALQLGGVARAYPLKPLLSRRVVNDTVAGERVVLVAEPESGEVRAYRGGGGFRPAGELLVDGRGGEWAVEESGLRPIGGGEGLARLPGHLAFWFGWYALHPRTEVWSGE